MAWLAVRELETKSGFSAWLSSLLEEHYISVNYAVAITSIVRDGGSRREKKLQLLSFFAHLPNGDSLIDTILEEYKRMGGQSPRSRDGHADGISVARMRMEGLYVGASSFVPAPPAEEIEPPQPYSQPEGEREEDMSEFSMVLAMFGGSLSEHAITDAWNSCGCDLQATVEHLIAEDAEVDGAGFDDDEHLHDNGGGGEGDPSFPHDYGTLRQPQPRIASNVCTFFMRGNCLRADCSFVHDPNARTIARVCKYWLQGRCYKGEECEFAHRESLPSVSTDAPHTVPSPNAVDDFPPLSSGDFPALPGSPGGGGQPATTRGGDNLATRLKKSLRGEAPPLPAASYRPRPTDPRLRKRKKKKQQHQWVQTGSAVSHLYASLRADAAEHAFARNRCFQSATEAYLVGDKRAATNMSQKGRQHQAEMEKLHAQAGALILNSRNSDERPRMLDLHGLHVHEALSALRRKLRECGTDGDAFLDVVVGTGHHSTDAKARVGPAVERALAEDGYVFDDVSSDQRGGMLRVYLT